MTGESSGDDHGLIWIGIAAIAIYLAVEAGWIPTPPRPAPANAAPASPKLKRKFRLFPYPHRETRQWQSSSQ